MEGLDSFFVEVLKINDDFRVATITCKESSNLDLECGEISLNNHDRVKNNESRRETNVEC